MTFYIMQQDLSIEGRPAIDGLPENLGVLNSSKLGDELVEEAALTVDLAPESGDYRGHIIDGFATLYHEDLKIALDSLGVNNIDYYPVNLRNPKRNCVESGYFIVDGIKLFDCVDMEKSLVKPCIAGAGFDFLSMVIDESRTNGAKIFRLKDDPTKVIISRELKQYFDQTNMLEGVEFIKTEDYADW